MQKNNFGSKFFCFFLLCFFLCASFSSDEAHSCASLFLAKEGKPSSKMIALLQIDGLYDPEDTLLQIVEKTQKYWLKVAYGQAGRERRDLVDTEEMALHRSKIVELARSMGLFSKREPLLAHYDYAICYGGFLWGVRSHLLELVRLWEMGIRFDALFFFGSERILRKEEMEKLGQPSFETEYEMMRLVWQEMEIPTEMREALEGKIFFLKTISKKFPRASLKDHYRSWLLQYHPKKGTILAVSYPICWCYQQLAGANVLPEDFFLDTVAPALSAEEYQEQEKAIVSQIHDAIAKALFEIADKKIGERKDKQRQPRSCL